MSDFEALCFCDGACRGNPGKAALGVVIYHFPTRKRFRYYKYLGDKLTNNYAEYSAVIFCLEKLIQAKIKTFELVADSQVLIRQINGEYSVSSKNIIPLYSKVKELLENFEKYRFVHVLRKYNAEADALANEAIDELSRK